MYLILMIYYNIAIKFRFGGMLPFVIDVKKNELIPKNVNNLSLIDTVCNRREYKSLEIK